jgi:formylglycine-generating enzyme required for sulfatase activity
LFASDTAARDVVGAEPPTKVGRTASPDASGIVTLRAPAQGRVLVRSGTFMMGSDVAEIELATSLCKAEPAGEACEEDKFSHEFAPHPVFLDDYFIDRLEVAMGDYQRCVEAGPCGALPLAAGGRRFLRPELPATVVTWNDAGTYCRWIGGRLPTEAEWERAARGMVGRRYPWGNTFDPYLTNGGKMSLEPFEEKDGFLESAPVGSFAEARTPDGILDLSGNVEEWVSDWYAPEYPEMSAANPQGPGVGDERVVRGGSYAHGRAWLRGASRSRALPSMRAAWRGFRCAYEAR